LNGNRFASKREKSQSHLFTRMDNLDRSNYEGTSLVNYTTFIIFKMSNFLPNVEEITDELPCRFWGDRSTAAQIFQILLNIWENGLHNVDNTSTEVKKTYDSISKKFRMTFLITSNIHANN
jgi:hypothetical protein